MTPSKRYARSTVIALCLLSLAAALTACSKPSIRPYSAPTPPPVVNCDRTPPPALVPFVPQLRGAADIPANDAWKADMIGLYQAEVTIRLDEHACWDKLRKGGVIR
jgi:hypothetical protein